MDFANYYVEFLTIALAHLIAVASPGPDFAIVLKHSISHGRRVALYTSLGIGAAIFLHVAYALFGIGLIIHSTPWLYDVLIILASGFLIYIGLGAIRSQSATPQRINEEKEVSKSLTDQKAFFVGFLTNGLNPKATLFFLSLFTVIIDVKTPNEIKAAYGVYLAFATTLWFALLSLLLTKQNVRQFFQRKAYIFDRVMGWVLILLALNILYSEILNKLI